MADRNNVRTSLLLIQDAELRIRIYDETHLVPRCFPIRAAIELAERARGAHNNVGMRGLSSIL